LYLFAGLTLVPVLLQCGMTEIKIPKIGTRVEVLTRYTLEWMNEYRQPTIGIVAHSNPWDQPGTFRLIGIETPNNHIGESVINLEYVEDLKVLGSKSLLEPTEMTSPKIQSFEIQGSKGDVYVVTIDGDKSSCTCPAGTHGRQCKHVKAAREQMADS